ncbi:C4-dicarboxylate-binding periplasmic protein DctP [Antarctobacter heliothermus]|uniref:C4-dicarboxylate-binding periplasmic protein DctP n=1 Tax=Antarctobacter heliothermus TaxID=74033 RepID=A0A222E0J6_9RHOB|nr:C4-dicarboxylate TRAP transporter substrate-binding protein [Antarctobacter heliothermus]ASP19662.1 C4-dicarboxylate-binding periplasmic protein DctP [Antarctobacter heliothermus]MBT53077.1 C4-dicarboxylate ABC transporter [Mameliella sp.]|tara:strand:+ start:3634 stop:4710 length:1077 start_codon:yes stop_codon:yes gene_type:complete
MTFVSKGLTATLAVLLTTAAPVWAQESITINVIDGYPARSMWVQEFTNFFIPEVDKRLAETGAYTIDWRESYGGTVVKPRGVLEGLQLGLGDIGIVTTIFHSSKLPSQAIAAVTPFVSSDARVVAKAVDEIAREFPTMQEEFAAQNQVYLTTGVVLDTYQLFSRDKVESLADLEGTKIAGAGMNLRYVEGIEGAAGVRGGLTDFYNMMQTGLVDSSMLWPEAAATFKISEVGPYMLEADLGAVNTKTVTANADFWGGLPEEVQTAITEVAVAYRDHLADLAMERAAEARDAYVAGGGTIVPMSDEQRAAWVGSMPDIAAEWAMGLDDDGKPGSDMLRAYLAKVSDGNALRDWTAGLPK